MFTLILGGAGSGKSALAEKLVQSLPGERVYLATMDAADEESRRRIRRHRVLRAGKGFQTVERSRNIAAAALPDHANVLLEDLSNLLANECFHPAGGGVEKAARDVLSLRDRAVHLTVVTNEVFLDGAAREAETVRYMQNLAALNRLFARKADLVVEVVCGLPNVLKGDLPW